ncbi:MAG: D-hexose-6-phosphate mutarotase [Chromatiaceae bacterium]|nr:D-hexose-6-phosphate mutarotase [Chromatiaceae bacterium]MCP5312713.1 D-hexose-6-phosphate mutarotase [Chromatiaceae bacterium]
MDIAALNTRFGAPGEITFAAGQGGLPVVRIRNRSAEALVSLYGGQVLAFRSAEAQADLLFLSERAHYQAGKAIKGGIPICWPWFGDDPEGRGRGAHGFARNRLWSVVDVRQLESGETRLDLRLTGDADSRPLWSHDFELELRITVGPSLALLLVTRNTGAQPFIVTQALHTYFAVGDIDQVSVHGLDGQHFLDKVRGFARAQQSGPVRFDREVDRIYLQTAGPLQIDDASLQRRILIEALGSQTAVVWNPWQAVARASADLADDAYRHFVCVETANAADDAIEVTAGGEHQIGARYAIAPIAYG